MSANGVASTVPIYVGELNSVYANPGKQTVSITNGLFASTSLGTVGTAFTATLPPWSMSVVTLR